MNQDQVKDLLLKIEQSEEEFFVIFTGKKSLKVNGFYKPEERTIFIHNKNMKTDNSLIYTSIHEYAHHLHFISSSLPISNRCHTKEFWAIFHKLLDRAEELDIYKPIYKTEKDFLDITKYLKDKYLKGNAEAMVCFGKDLLKAYKLCEKYDVRFDDYIDRGLGFNRRIAKSLMDISSLNIDTKIGYDNMKVVASIKNKDDRKNAEEMFLNGATTDIIKNKYFIKPEKSKKQQLEDEQKRILRTINNLKSRLEEIERRLSFEEDRKI